MRGKTKTFAFIVMALLFLSSVAFAQSSEVKRSQVLVGAILPGCGSADRYRSAAQLTDHELTLDFCLGSHPDGGKGGIDIGVYGTWTPKVTVKGFDVGLDRHYRDPRILTTLRQVPAPTIAGKPIERFAGLGVSGDAETLAAQLKTLLDYGTGRIPYPTSTSSTFIQTTSKNFSFTSPDFPNDTVVVTIRILAANYTRTLLHETLIANLSYQRYGTKDGAAKAAADAASDGTAPTPAPTPTPSPSPAPGTSPTPAAPPAGSFQIYLTTIEAPGTTITSTRLSRLENTGGKIVETVVATGLAPEIESGAIKKDPVDPKKYPGYGGFVWRYYLATVSRGFYRLDATYNTGKGFRADYECFPSGTSGGCSPVDYAWLG